MNPNFIHLAWKGPLSIEAAKALTNEEQDYGLYAVYGSHVVLVRMFFSTSVKPLSRPSASGSGSTFGGWIITRTPRICRSMSLGYVVPKIARMKNGVQESTEPKS